MLAPTAVLLTAAYLLVWALERVPALRFRSAPWLRRYVATDMAWYVVALGAVAVSAIVFRPQLQRVCIGPVASAFRVSRVKRVFALPTLNYSDHYIRHYNFTVYAATDGGSNAWYNANFWTDDVSWVVTSPWA